MFDFLVDKHLFVIYNANIEQTFAVNKCSVACILVYNLSWQVFQPIDELCIRKNKFMDYRPEIQSSISKRGSSYENESFKTYNEKAYPQIDHRCFYDLTGLYDIRIILCFSP